MVAQTLDTETKQFAVRKTIDWMAAKKVYVERTPCPTYSELAKEFGCSVQAVSTVARDEDWPAFRKTRQDKTMLECAANDALIKATENEGPILNQSRTVATQVVSAVEICLQKLMADADKSKASSMANTLNTLCFALANAGKFMEGLGLIGVSKMLGKARKAGDSGEVPWDRGLMQQISVTVNGLTSKGSDPKPVDVNQATESRSIATDPIADPIASENVTD